MIHGATMTKCSQAVLHGHFSIDIGQQISTWKKFSQQWATFCNHPDPDKLPCVLPVRLLPSTIAQKVYHHLKNLWNVSVFSLPWSYIFQWIYSHFKKVLSVSQLNICPFNPRTLREKTTLAVTSKGRFGTEEEKGPGVSSTRRRSTPRNLTPVAVGANESVMVQALRLEEQQRAKEEKRWACFAVHSGWSTLECCWQSLNHANNKTENFFIF